MRPEERQRHREIDAAHVGAALAKVFLAKIRSEPGSEVYELLVAAERMLNGNGCVQWMERPHCGKCGAPKSPEVGIGCVDCGEEE